MTVHCVTCLRLPHPTACRTPATHPANGIAGIIMILLSRKNINEARTIPRLQKTHNVRYPACHNLVNFISPWRQHRSSQFVTSFVVCATSNFARIQKSIHYFIIDIKNDRPCAARVGSVTPSTERREVRSVSFTILAAFTV